MKLVKLFVFAVNHLDQLLSAHASLRRVKCPSASSSGVISVERKASSMTAISSCVAAFFSRSVFERSVAMCLSAAMFVETSELSSRGSNTSMLCSLHLHQTSLHESFGAGHMSIVNKVSSFWLNDLRSFWNLLTVDFLSKTGLPQIAVA